MKTYSVSLANSDCIFDSAEGFETLEAAKAWATGRSAGESYHIMIESSDDSENTSCGLCVDCWEDYDGNHKTRGIWGWEDAEW